MSVGHLILLAVVGVPAIMLIVYAARGGYVGAECRERIALLRMQHQIWKVEQQQAAEREEILAARDAMVSMQKALNVCPREKDVSG